MLNSSKESVTQTYAEKQTKLVAFLSQTSDLIKELYRQSPDDKYILHYPKTGSESTSIASTPITVNGARSSPLSNALSSSNQPSQRLYLLGPSVDIIRHELDEFSMSKVLADKLLASTSHLEKLKQRICDKTSKILITGDVNGGKSTLVNALLGAQVLPTDQQPCTQSFCEVIPSPRQEMPAVQAIKDLDYYSPANSKSFFEMSVEEMQESIQHEDSDITWYRLFWPVRSNDSKRFTAGSALDISLIDSPGLNSDLFKTTSLFSRQADIDVVIFVINAANHLTLSAREFLERAAKEKEHIFIVVNKFDDIKNQDKCRRIIMQQISEVLPQTFKEANLLIHFVSAGPYLTSLSKREASDPAFERLETCLRDFIFENRTRSKLYPAYTYIVRLLTDLNVILDENCRRLERESSRLQTDLELICPCYDQLASNDLPIRAAIQESVNQTSKLCYQGCTTELSAFRQDLHSYVSRVHWAGILKVYGFRQAVMNQIKIDLEKVLLEAKSKAIETTLTGLYELNAVATAHAHQVFSGETAQMNRAGIEKCFQIDCKPPVALPELAPWDLIDVGEEIFSTKTWVGATTVAAAFFGYRPLMSIGLHIIDIFGPKRFSRLNVTLLVGGALAAGLLILDFESMVRRRLSSHLAETFTTGTWLQDYAREMESVTRDVMLQSSMSLISRFEEALNQQRRLRAEKDIERRQCETILSYFQRHNSSVLNLRLAVESFKV